MLRKKHITILLLIVCISILVVYYHGQEFRKQHHLTVAKVLHCDGGGKGNAGPGIYYVYELGGKMISSSRRHGELKYSIHNLENHFFPVVYQKNWFGYDDIILITPHDFSYYGYSFPDSLNWILPLIKK